MSTDDFHYNIEKSENQAFFLFRLYWVTIYHYGTGDTKENKTLSVDKGAAFVQGIFLQFGIAEDDNVEEIRNGGLGSTTK